MKTELQGEGTYDYRCTKQDCLFCRQMAVIEVNETIPKTPAFKKHKPVINQTAWPKFRNATMFKST